jgi:hypothetical protein
MSLSLQALFIAESGVGAMYPNVYYAIRVYIIDLDTVDTLVGNGLMVGARC